MQFLVIRVLKESHAKSETACMHRRLTFDDDVDDVDDER